MKNVDKAFKFLTGCYPCFHSAANVKPLKIGIHKDIKIPLHSSLRMTHICAALKKYTNSHAYLKACKEGVERVGLDDTPCGKVVTPVQAKHALEILTERAFKSRKDE